MPAGALSRTAGPVLAVALNGARRPEEHPAIPRTPAELATAARESVDVGADVLHLHAYGDDGVESLDGTACSAALRAVREGCPGVPVSLTTSAAIEPDAKRRQRLVDAWTELPELVTANQGEAGILELCESLLSRGVGIEAGLLELPDAEAFLASGLAARCTRVLIEPLDADPGEAVEHAAAIERLLSDGGIRLEQVHHGDGIASWAVSARAAALGHGIRTGLEDTTVLPGGELAPDNAALVRAAARLLHDTRES
jgi:uncharacterized protein (DUF849 family)